MNIKKTLLLLLTIICTFACLENTNALAGYTTGTLINIRKEPKVSGEFVHQIASSNTILDVVSEELYNQGDKDCNIGWYKINYNNQEAYVCGEFVSLGNTGDNNPSYNEKTFQARINDVRVTARPTASYSNSAKAVLLPGTNVIIMGDKVYNNDCTDGWYHVKYYKNDTGYVCSTYVKTKEELTGQNASYEQELKNKGFPDSYISYLVKLHELHPNWEFNPIMTNVDWNRYVSVETGSNVVHKEYINDVVSPLYQTGVFVEKDYRVTTDAVNAFFLDPRNFLTETFIFMFERLNYDYDNDNRNALNRDSEQTKFYYNVISNLLRNSYANNDDYKYWFIDAGFKSNVNPIYLTSLSYQEGPLSNKENPSILGTHSTLYYEDGKGYSVNGYYNFFNIGAYWSGVNSPTTRALAYACGPACTFNSSYGRPWDTVEKAIYGGAEWIADGYIANGQNTMYFKKFNSSPTSPHNLGAHQYQTNITAPCSESVKEYEAFKAANILDSKLIFDIPIFNNMPNTISLPEIASTVNTLNEIKVDGKVVEGYDRDVIEYTVYVPLDYTSVKVEATKADNLSEVKGLGTVTLSEDKTEHKITVTAENGAIKTYSLTIIKTEDTTTVQDILNNLSVKVNGNMMNHISPETSANALIQSILKNCPKAEVTIYASNGTAINGSSLIQTGGRIKITAPTETKEFTTVVTGDTNGDGIVSILDLLRVQKHILGSSPLSDHNLKAADTNNDNKVDILDLLRVQKHILKSISL